MSRVAYFGRELCRRNGETYGINFGFGLCTEHEQGVLSLIDDLNKTDNKKEYNQGFKAGKKYIGTPFGRCLLRSNLEIIEKDITIDNSKFRLNSLVASGNYKYYRIAKPFYYKYDKVDGRRTYDESDIWDMSDLAVPESVGKLVQMNHGAAWDTQNGITILVRKDWNGQEGLADQIGISLRKGALALLNGNAGLFNYNGLSFAFIDKIYG